MDNTGQLYLLVEYQSQLRTWMLGLQKPKLMRDQPIFPYRWIMSVYAISSDTGQTLRIVETHGRGSLRLTSASFSYMNAGRPRNRLNIL